MYYNIESYTPDMERLFGDYTSYKLGQGWPAYKNVTVEQMADIMEDVAFTPKYDVREGTSNVVVPNIRTDIPQRDMEIMKALYSQLNKVLSGYVERVVDDYEYINSPIYDELGIDRETLAQIVDKVINLAEEEMDDAQEIGLEAQQFEVWNRKNMLVVFGEKVEKNL